MRKWVQLVNDKVHGKQYAPSDFVVHAVQVHQGQQDKHRHNLHFGQIRQFADLDAYQQAHKVYDCDLSFSLGGNVSDIVAVTRKRLVSV